MENNELNKLREVEIITIDNWLRLFDKGLLSEREVVNRIILLIWNEKSSLGHRAFEKMYGIGD